MVNRRLSTFNLDDGLSVNPTTWQVMRGKEVVTRAEAQKFRERRLGVSAQAFGVMTQQERDFRRDRVRPEGPASLPKVFAPRNYQLKPGDETLLARMIFAEGANTPEIRRPLAGRSSIASVIRKMVTA